MARFHIAVSPPLTLLLSSMSKGVVLDSIDLEILKRLTYDARASYSSIASILGITVNTVKNRIKKLVAGKVIQNFMTVPNFAIFGFDKSFNILVRHDGNSEERTASRLASLGYLYMQVSLFENTSVFRLFFKKETRVPSIKEIAGLIKPSKVVVKFTEELRYDFTPSQTDWKIIYWLLLEPRIKIKDLAKRTSVTEKTVIRRLGVMSKERILDFTVHCNKAAMSNYLDFRLIVITDNSLYDNVVSQLHKQSEDHFMFVVPPSFETMVLLTLFARNLSELESVTEKIGSIKGVLKVIPIIPLGMHLNLKHLLDEISKKIKLDDGAAASF